MRTVVALLAVAVVTVLVMVGCGGGGNSADSLIDGVGAPGTVRLLVADAPLASCSAVNVVITRVDLLYDGVVDSQPPADDTGTPDTTLASEESDDVAVTLFRGAREVNLLDIANTPLDQLIALADTAIPSGHYKQLRLVLADTGNTVVLQDGTTHALKVPSGVLKLPLHLTVSPEETETIILDFDLSAPNALKLTGQGNYMLKPVLRTIKASHTGSLRSTLLLSTLAPTDSLDATVVATANGVDYTTMVTFGENEDGIATQAGIVIHGLPLGTYPVTLTVTADGQAFTFTQDVTVEQGRPADLGTLLL